MRHLGAAPWCGTYERHLGAALLLPLSVGVVTLHDMPRAAAKPCRLGQRGHDLEFWSTHVVFTAACLPEERVQLVADARPGARAAWNWLLSHVEEAVLLQEFTATRFRK